MGVLSNIFNESKAKGIDTPKEATSLYDQGIPKEEPTPNINISSMPQQQTMEPVQPIDDQFGFVDRFAFGLPEELKETEPMALGFSPETAFLQAAEERTSALDFMDLPDEASDLAKTAAYNSDIRYRPYSVGGTLVRSFMSGVGQVINGLADTAEWVDSLTGGVSGNVINPLQLPGELIGVDLNQSIDNVWRSLGDELESWDDKVDMSGIDGQFFTKDENGKIKVSYGQMLNGKFWYTKVAQQIPNLLMFMIPAGWGARGAKALASGTKFGKANILSIPRLSKNVKHFGSKGGGNKPLLQIKGEEAAAFFGGAAGGNFSEGAMIAGESYRQALDMGATKDQAAQAGWGVMKDNALWMVADGLQYAILTKGLGGIGKSIKMSAGSNFKGVMGQFLIGSGLAVSEGKLEELQEVYQDWRTKIRAHEVRGEKFEYEDSYWDYYHSEEMAETRVVAFGLGFGSTGVSVLGNSGKEIINNIAERNNILDNKLEHNLTNESGAVLFFANAAKQVKDKGFQKGTYTEAEKAIIRKEEHRESFLSGIIAEGEINVAKERIKELVKKGEENGGISKKDGNAYIKKLDDMQATFAPYNNIGLQRLLPEARRELARIAYYMSQSKSDMASNNDFYNGQIESVQNALKEGTISQTVADQQISAIKAEQTTANARVQETIEGYKGVIDTLFTDSLRIAQEQEAAVDAKNQEKRIAEANRREAEKPTTVGTNRLEQVNQELSELESQAQGMGVVNKELKDRIDQLKQEKSLLEAPQKTVQVERVKKLKKQISSIQNKIDKIYKSTPTVQNEKKLRELQNEQDALYEQQLEAEGFGSNLAEYETKRRRKKIRKAEKKTKDNPGTSNQQELELGHVGVLTKGKTAERRFIGYEKVFRERLRKQGINLVVFDHMMKSRDGARFYGLSQGLSMFLDAGSASQETFYHELSHIYLAEYWESPPVKALQKLVAKSPLYDKIKRIYYSQTIFQNSKGAKVRLQSLISANEVLGYKAWKQSTKAKDKSIESYLKAQKTKLKKAGYKVAPKSQQRFILEEAVADLLGKRMDQKTKDQKINKEDQPNTDRAIIRFWAYAKNKFNKQESQEILENTGNETLAEKIDNAVEEVVKDFNSKENKYEYRRDRSGFRNKMAHMSQELDVRQRASEQIKGIIENLRQSPEGKELASLTKNPLYRNQKTRQNTALFTKKIANFFQSQVPKIKSVIENNPGGIDNDIYQYLFKDNGTPKKTLASVLNDNLRKTKKSGAASIDSALQEFTEDDTNWLENYLDTRNGEGSLGNFMLEYVGSEEKIKGFEVNINHLRQVLYNSVWNSASLGDYKANIESIINSIKAAKSLKREEEILGKFMMYMQEHYNGNPEVQGNVIEHIRHELKGYKKIKFFTINKSGGTFRLKEHLGVSRNSTYNQIIKGINERLDYQGETKTEDNALDSKEIARYNYLSSLITLHKQMQAKKSDISDRQKLDLAKKFVYENFLVNQKDFATDYTSISDSSVKGFVVKNKDGKTMTQRLLEDTALIGVQTKEGKSIGNPKTSEKVKIKVTNAWSKWKQRPEIQQALEQGHIDKETLTNIGSLLTWSIQNNTFATNNKTKNRIYLTENGEMSFKDRGPAPSILTYKGSAIAEITNSITEQLGLAEFESQIPMPSGEKTNLMSKKHQIDILLEQMETMLSQENGKEKLLSLFGNNIILEKLLEQNKLPEVVQLIGTYMDKIGVDSGKLKGEEYALAQIGLISDALANKNTKEYGQSVSIFSDKNIDIYIKNAPLIRYFEIVNGKVKRTKEGAELIERMQGKSKFKNGSDYLKIEKKLYNDLLTLLNNSSNINVPKSIDKFIKRKEDSEGNMGPIIVTPELESHLLNIAMNYAINKQQAKDLLIGPSEFFDGPRDYIKRAAGSVAMGVSLGSDVRIEPLMLQDVKVNIGGEEINKTDACSFILPEDADMIKDKYGGIRQVGDHFKFVYNGQNLDNTTFANRVGARHPFYGKTNVFQLTESFLENNPNFRPIAESLRIRRNNTQGGDVSVMPIAMFSSAIKVQSNNLKNSLLSVDRLAEMNSSGEINTHQDALFTSDSVNGLDGSYFTLQTELDKTSSSATVAKQIIAHLLSLPGNRNQAVKVQKLWLDAFAQKMNTKLNQMSISKDKNFSKNIAAAIDIEVYGASAAELIQKGSFDSNSIEIMRKIIKSQYQKSLKIRGVGGMAYQSTDFASGPEVATNKISKSTGLKSYTKDSSGNITGEAEVDIDASLGFEAGDVILLQRVPASKLGDAIIGKVRNVINNSGSMVVVSSELSHKIGSDLDGDAFHVVGFNKSKGGKQLTQEQEKYNTALEETIKFMKDKSNAAYMDTGIDFGAAVTKAKKFVEDIGLSFVDNNQNDLSVLGNQNMYNSNIADKNMIGLAAQFNTGHKILSSFDVQGHDIGVTINEKKVGQSYRDNGSSWLNLAYVLNIHIDNANKGSASSLNMNPYTFTIYSTLLARNVDFNTVASILLHPVTLKMTEIMRKRGTMDHHVALQEMGYSHTELFYPGGVALISGNKEVGENVNIDKTFSRQGRQVAKLLHEIVGSHSYETKQGKPRTQPHVAQEFIKTINTLANLDNNMPPNIYEALEMQDNIKTVIESVVGTKFKNQKQKEKLNISDLYSGGVFKSPILQRNYEKLEQYVEDLKSMDPAYNSRYSEVVLEYVRSQDFGLSTKGKRDLIKETETIVRQMRIYAESDGLYMWEPTALIDNTITKDNSIVEKLADPYTSLQDQINISLQHLLEVSQNNKNYEFFNYVEISTNKKGNKFIKIAKNTKLNGEAANKAFNKLPLKVQNYLLTYDLFVNRHEGVNTMLPYMGKKKNAVAKETRKQVESQVNEIKKGESISFTEQSQKRLKEYISERREGKLIMPPESSKPTHPKGTKVEKIIKEGPIEMAQLMEEETETKTTFKPIGRVNGKNIVDTDGAFGSELMYMLSDEMDELEGFVGQKNRQQYINQRTAKLNMDLEKMAPAQKKAWEKEYDVYKKDFIEVSKMTEKLEVLDANGRMAMESDNYSVKDLLGIMKKLNTLDPVAKDNLYLKVGRVMAAKIALNTINAEISNAKKKRLSDKIIEKLEAEKQRIEQGGGRLDITSGDKWLSPDITSIERAEIGVLLNKLNEEQMSYQKDMMKIDKKMSTAYSNLLKSRFKSGMIPWFLNYAIYKFIPYASHFYTEFLFKNIIVHTQEKITEGKFKGKYKRVLRLKTEKEIAGSKLTKEEKAYWEMYREITGMIGDHLSQKIGEDGQVVLSKERQRKQGKTYIPHLTASKVEMMLARNLTAAYVANNYSDILTDVNVTGINPNTGQRETKPLSMFVDDYMINQIGERVSRSDYQRKQALQALVKQANDYMTKGTDAKGMPVLKPEDAESAVGSDTFNRYLNKRSRRAEFGASIDIHKSLSAYVRKQVFDYGLSSQKGFSFNGMRENIPLIDGIMSYASFNNNPDTQKWVKELLLDRYVYKKGRKSILTKDGQRNWADDIFSVLQQWTMFVGLGLNVPAAVGNVLIGKYNTFRQQGFTNWALGEKRYFGFGVKGFNKVNADKSRYITEYFGLITDAQAQIREDVFSSGFGDLVFAFMMGSEKYIQRTQFVGQMTENEWNSFEVVNGEIKVIPGKEKAFEALTKNADRYKSKVYEVQGKGYTDLDQRMIQSYSILNGILQFKRWLPTFVMDRMSGEKMTRSGEWYIGTYKATFDYFADIVRDKNGRDIRKDIFLSGQKYKNLPQHRKDAIQRAKRGTLGMMIVAGFAALLGGFSEDEDDSAVVGQLRKTFWDMNLMINIDKWKYMAGVPAVSTASNLLFGMKELVTGARYQRDTKYGLEGDLKARGRLARLFPTLVRQQFAREPKSNK